jgi:hypothetical protein
MGITRDMKSRSSITVSDGPVTIGSSTTTSGAGVDISGAVAVNVIFGIGVRTDGTFTPNVQTSDESNANFVSLDASEMIGAETAITATDGVTVVGIKGNNLKKYVRGQFVSTAVTSGATGCYILVQEFTS